MDSRLSRWPRRIFLTAFAALLCLTLWGEGFIKTSQEVVKASPPKLLFIPAIFKPVPPIYTLTATDVQIPGLIGNEPHAAVVNPQNPANVVISWVNRLRISNDFGTTFPIITNAAGFLAGYGGSGDDVLTFDAAGRLWWVYLMSIDGNNDGKMDNLAFDDITIVAQQVNPLTGALVGNAIDLTPGNHFDDKPWIAADANPTSPFANNVYVHWTRFDNNPTEEFFSRCVNCASTNTFSVPANIATGPGEGFRHQSNVAVAANGYVFVSYHTNTCGQNESDGDIVLMRDGNGGADLAEGGNPPTGVVKTNVFGSGGAEVTCNRQPQPPTVPKARFLMQGAAAPFVVTDPVRPGNIYVIVNDDPDDLAGSGDDGDVIMARSTDYGNTFTIQRVDHAPQGPASLQVFPQGTIDQDGNLVVFWYDTRRQLNNNGLDGIAGTADDYWNLDVYATVSRDGGLTFSNDFRINDTPFDPQLGAPNFKNDNPPTYRIGEYNGIAAANGIGYAAWTGNAGGGQQIFFDAFSLLGVTPDHLEPNESIDSAVVASLGFDDTYNLSRLSIHSATDVDFFKVVALHTGKLEAQISFNERIDRMSLSAYDKYGNMVGFGSYTNIRTGSSLDTLSLPVIEGEPYFFKVYGGFPNSNPPQSTYDLTIANRPTPVPFGLDLVAASDSGISDQDNVTYVAAATIRIQVNEDLLSGLSFSPTNDSNLTDDDPGFKVRIYRNGIVAGYATPVAGLPGVFEFTFNAIPLSEGINSITSRVLIVDPSDDPNIAGTTHLLRTGGESGALYVTLDTTPPPAPSIPDLLASSDSGASDTDNITNVNPPAFQGTGETNDIIRILANGVIVGQEFIGSDYSDGIPGNSLGAWEVTVEPLDDGTYNITSQAEDLAGNISLESAPMTPALVIDTASGGGMPQRPTIDLINSFDTGRSDMDNITNKTVLDFRVTADPNTTVVIKDGNMVIDTFAMPASGEIIRTLTLSEGSHPLSTESIDLAGNTSHQSQELLITVDITPPVVSAPDLAAYSDSGGINDDNVTTIVSPAFLGHEEANALVKIFVGGVKVGQGVVGSDESDGMGGNGLGLYEVTVEPLNDSVYNVTATLEDVAGNISVSSLALQVTIANQVLNLSGAASGVMVTLENDQVSGYPGYPSAGSVVGIFGIPVVNLDVNGRSLTILGTPLGDEFAYTPTGPQSGRFTRQGSDQVINFTATAGTFTLDPQSGIDTVTVNGTAAVDIVNASVDLGLTTVQVNDWKTVTLPIANVEMLALNILDGADTINLYIYDTVNAHLFVDAGNPESTNPVSDVLNVFASSPKGHLQKQPGGPVPGSGTVFVSYPLTTNNESRIDYAYVENINLNK